MAWGESADLYVYICIDIDLYTYLLTVQHPVVITSQ